MKGIFAVLAMAVLLGGCGLTGGQQMKTTRITVDPDTKVKTTVIEEPMQQTAGGFWKSENLEEHYKFETARTSAHNASVDKKVEAISQNVAHVMALNGPTPTEKLLVGVIGTLSINQIPTSPGPSGVKPPSTIVDFANGNAINLGNLMLNAWGVFGGDRGSEDNDTTTDIVNSGDGMVFVNSNQNTAQLQSAKYTLGDSQGDLSFQAPSQVPTNSFTDRHDTDNSRVDSASSESKETTLW